MNKLEFTLREKTHSSGRVIQFHDYVVDGRPLEEYLFGHAARPAEFGVTPFGFLTSPSVRDYIDRHVGRKPSELPSGRIPLYICAECGDVGCGAWVARIDRELDVVVWREFRREDGMAMPIESPESYQPAEGEPELFAYLEFKFDRRQYDHAIKNLRSYYGA